MKLTMCVHGMLGDCPKCLFDMDTSHHPNNMDCPRFKPLGFLFIKIEPAKERKNDSIQGVSDEA